MALESTKGSYDDSALMRRCHSIAIQKPIGLSKILDPTSQ